ncbi:hypothetical protein JHK85_009507 [Glycine max]|nr:hypothetical protein JHK85_009507 [Glycine max]
MAQDIATPPVPFDFELLVGDHLRTVTASSNSSRTDPWIEPERLKLRHRIGRGPFGDVWLATHHQSTEDYDEYHEVAAKMLPPIREEHMKTALEKFCELYFQCQGAARICIIMNFYEGSVGDKMAKLREGRISLPGVLRYGINLAKGILELHSKGILVLNLKPSNVLLDDTDQAILGDIGIPNLLFGSSFLSSDMANRLGTPNYMAPEQWQPEVRGPVSFETDSWGFGCTILEMLTGNQPWYGCPVGEIYQSVVEKYEKPLIPSGLPSSVENILSGCFEYDLRNRPSMVDILAVFRSSLNAVANDGGWIYLGTNKTMAKSSSTGYSQWSLSKDHLQVGDTVRSRKLSNSCNPQNMEVPEGNVVGLERNVDHGFVLVRLHGVHDPVRIRASTLERVTNGLGAGDWVRLKEEDDKHSPVGILHSINRDGRVTVGFIGLQTLWNGNCSDLEMAEPYCVGQFIRLKANVLSPRFEWPRKRGGAWATGKISWILPNGCLVVKFPGMLNFWDAPRTVLADPSEVDVVNFKNCPKMIEKYQHVEDHHWAVRPVLIAFGFLTAVKLGMSIGKKLGRNMNANAMDSESHYTDNQNASPTWTSSVANIFSREGVNLANGR